MFVAAAPATGTASAPLELLVMVGSAWAVASDTSVVPQGCHQLKTRQMNPYQHTVHHLAA